MEKDRKIICDVISEMLDNPDHLEIYKTSEVYNKLERYIEQERMIAIGWTHADSCIDLDKGNDPRKKEVGGLIERALKELA